MESIPLPALTSPSGICDGQVAQCRIEGGVPLLPGYFSAMVLTAQVNCHFLHHGGKVDIEVRTSVCALSMRKQKQ
jgi:hypothetical protein